MLLFLVTLHSGVVIVVLINVVDDDAVFRSLIITLSYMTETTRTLYIFVGISYYASFCGKWSKMDENRLITFTDIAKHAVFSLFIIFLLLIDSKPLWMLQNDNNEEEKENEEEDIIPNNSDIFIQIVFKSLPPIIILLIYGLWYSFQYKSDISGKTAEDPYKGISWAIIKWMTIIVIPFCFLVSMGTCFFNIYIKKGSYEKWLNSC